MVINEAQLGSESKGRNYQLLYDSFYIQISTVELPIRWFAMTFCNVGPQFDDYSNKKNEDVIRNKGQSQLEVKITSIGHIASYRNSAYDI